MFKKITKKTKIILTGGLVILVATLMGGCFEKVDVEKAVINQVKKTVQEQTGGNINKIKQPKKKKGVKQDDAKTGGDVGNDIPNAHPITYGEFEGSLIAGTDNMDVYILRYEPGDIVDIEVTPSKGLDVAVITLPKGNDKTVHNNAFKGEKEMVRVVKDSSSKEKKYGIVVGFANIPPAKDKGRREEYTLKITQTKQNDGGSGKDASNNWDEPTPLKVGKYEGGWLFDGDKNDDYGVSLKSGQKATIVVTPEKGLDIAIGTASITGLIEGNFTDDFQVNENFKGEAETVIIEAKKTGVHKFNIGRVGKSFGKYSIDVKIQ